MTELSSICRTKLSAISKPTFLGYSGGLGVGGRPDRHVDWELYVTRFAYIFDQGYIGTRIGFILDSGFIDEIGEAGMRHHERREEHSPGAAQRL